MWNLASVLGAMWLLAIAAGVFMIHQRNVTIADLEARAAGECVIIGSVKPMVCKRGDCRTIEGWLK